MQEISLTERERYVLLRKRKKITLKVLAKILGCTVSNISKFENGVSNLSTDRLRLYKKYIESKS